MRATPLRPVGALSAVVDAGADGGVDPPDLVIRGGPLFEAISDMFKR